jgi:hypothetical protein
MITVYHNTNFIQYALHTYTTEQSKKILMNAKLLKAANVDTNDLTHAYACTNSISDHWSKNHSVTTTSRSSRSTSVGDVMRSSDGYYVVESFGYRKLSDEEVRSLIFLT